MKPDLKRNRILFALADRCETVKQLTEAINELGYQMRQKTVYATLYRSGKRFRCQGRKRERVEREIYSPPDADRVGLSREQWQQSKRFRRGDCLQCKKGTFNHPNWPGGRCPACAGTGRYLDEIMKRNGE